MLEPHTLNANDELLGAWLDWKANALLHRLFPTYMHFDIQEMRSASHRQVLIWRIVNSANSDVIGWMDLSFDTDRTHALLWLDLVYDVDHRLIAGPIYRALTSVLYLHRLVDIGCYVWGTDPGGVSVVLTALNGELVLDGRFYGQRIRPQQTSNNACMLGTRISVASDELTYVDSVPISTRVELKITTYSDEVNISLVHNNKVAVISSCFGSNDSADSGFLVWDTVVSWLDQTHPPIELLYDGTKDPRLLERLSALGQFASYYDEYWKIRQLAL